MTFDSTHVLSLARDASPNGRGRLLTLLADVLLRDAHPRPRELDLFYDIVRSVLPKAANGDRRQFSEIAADRRAVPHDLLLRLAHDDVDVAAPVLERSLDLNETDLVHVVQTLEEGHRLAVAARRTVPARVSGALVDHGGRAVLHRLGRNPGAVLDDVTTRELQRRAGSDLDLLRILLERTSTAPLVAAPARVRERGVHGLGARSHRDGEPIRDDATTTDAAATPTAAEPTAVPAPAAPAIESLLDAVKRGVRSAGDVVVELADADLHADLACFLAAVAEIEESQVIRVLVRADANGIGMLARGLDIAPEAFARLVDLRRRRLRLTTRQARWECEAFERIDQAEAKAMIAGLAVARRSA